MKIYFVMKYGVMVTSLFYKNRWNAVCGENRTHGVDRGKDRDDIKVLPIDITSRCVW